MEQYKKLIINILESGHSAVFTTNFERIFLRSLVLLMLHKNRFLFTAYELLYLEWRKSQPMVRPFLIALIIKMTTKMKLGMQWLFDHLVNFYFIYFLLHVEELSF